MSFLSMCIKTGAACMQTAAYIPTIQILGNDEQSLTRGENTGGRVALPATQPPLYLHIIYNVRKQRLQ